MSERGPRFPEVREADIELIDSLVKEYEESGPETKRGGLLDPLRQMLH
jgi:hypothetical protein